MTHQRRDITHYRTPPASAGLPSSSISGKMSRNNDLTPNTAAYFVVNMAAGDGVRHAALVVCSRYAWRRFGFEQPCGGPELSVVRGVPEWRHKLRLFNLCPMSGSAVRKRRRLRGKHPVQRTGERF